MLSEIIDRLTFSFDYSDQNADQCIIKTEQIIRDLIYQIMNQRYGSLWERDEKVGFSNSEIVDLEERIRQEKKRLGNQRLSDRLLDYGYIPDLQKIIIKNWPEFVHVFPSRETTMVYLQHIGIFRNPIIHNRRGILRHQKQLCVGMCGELVLHIDRWNSGFKRVIVGYSCLIAFSAFQRNHEKDESLKVRARKRADEWITNVEKLSTKAPEIKEMAGMGKSGRRPCKLIRLKEGNIVISQPFEAGRYDGEHYFDSIIRIYTQSVQVLDKIIFELNQPYSEITWLLKDPIDVMSIKEQRRELSAWSLELNPSTKKKFGPGLDVTVVNNFNDLPVDGIERMKRHEEIRILIGYSHVLGNKNSIGLLFDGRRENSFFRAHSIFSPDSLVSILLEETPMRQIRKMIKDARTLSPEQAK